MKVTENEPYKNMIYKAVISEGMDTICREWTVSTSITGTNGTVLDYSNKYNITDANEMEKNSLETFSLEDVDRRIPVKVKVLGQKNVRFLLDNGVIRASR